MWAIVVVYLLYRGACGRTNVLIEPGPWLGYGTLCFVYAMFEAGWSCPFGGLNLRCVGHVTVDMPWCHVKIVYCLAPA